MEMVPVRVGYGQKANIVNDVRLGCDGVGDGQKANIVNDVRMGCDWGHDRARPCRDVHRSHFKHP